MGVRHLVLWVMRMRKSLIESDEASDYLEKRETRSMRGREFSGTAGNTIGFSQENHHPELATVYAAFVCECGNV